MLVQRTRAHPGCCFHDSERAGEGHREPQGCFCSSSRASQRSFILGQLAQEEQQLGSLSFKGRTQRKPSSSSDAAGSARAIDAVPSYRAWLRSSSQESQAEKQPPCYPLLPQLLLNLIYFTAPCSLAEEAGGAGSSWRCLEERGAA